MKQYCIFLSSLFWLLGTTFMVAPVTYAETSAQKELTMKCPSCNTLYPEETKFCGKDGTRLVKKIIINICPICQKQGAPGEKFCREHGEKLVPMEELHPETRPDTPEKKKHLAIKYYKEGNELCDKELYDKAIESYKKAESIFPDFPALHYNMGWLFTKLGNVEKAVHHLQKYIVLSPDASDLTEVQSYIVILEQVQKRRKKLMETFLNRDKIMENALAEQKRKHDMVLVPAGEFLMGTNEGREISYPEHVVYLDAFRIDRYEVTNAQYWEFLQYMKKTNDHSKCHPEEPSGKDHTPRFWEDEYYNVPDYPVVRIDWFDAYAYAAWAGKRLPTEAEWEKAARGLDGRRFPWGNEWDPSRCDLSGEPKPVGSIETGKSIYGCYDMAGSVYEWCSDWFLDTYYMDSPSKNPKGPEDGIRRVIRGGSRFSKPFQVRTTARKSERPDLFNVSLGFRCVKDVEE